MRVRGTDGGYHDCRRGMPDHEGPHGNDVYGDFAPGHPVVKKRIGASAACNYEVVGVISKDDKVERTD